MTYRAVKISQIMPAPHVEREIIAAYFKCEPSEIACGSSEINPDTQVYAGSLEPGIFSNLEHVRYVYTSFPEGRIPRYRLEIGGKDATQLEAALDNEEIDVSPNARAMLRSREFITQPNPEVIETALLSVSHLGFTRTAENEAVFVRARELGLGKCYAEVGLYQRLAHIDQPAGTYYFIAIDPIIGKLDKPGVFQLECLGSGRLALFSDVTVPFGWAPGHRVLFSLPQQST